MSWHTPRCSGASASFCAESSHAAKRGSESSGSPPASSAPAPPPSPAACAHARAASSSSAPCSARAKAAKAARLRPSWPSAYSSKSARTPPPSSSRETQRSTCSIEKWPSAAERSGSSRLDSQLDDSRLDWRASHVRGVLSPRPPFRSLAPSSSSRLSLARSRIALSARCASNAAHAAAHSASRRAFSRSMHASSSGCASVRCGAAAPPHAQKASRTRATLSGVRASWLVSVGSISTTSAMPPARSPMAPRTSKRLPLRTTPASGQGRVTVVDAALSLHIP